MTLKVHNQVFFEYKTRVLTNIVFIIVLCVVVECFDTDFVTFCYLLNLVTSEVKTSNYNNTDANDNDDNNP